MPFIEVSEPPHDLSNLALPDPISQVPAGSVLGAAFREGNVLTSLVTKFGSDVPDPYELEDGFDAIDYVKDDPRFAPHVVEFAGIFNKKAADALKTQIAQEQADTRTIDAAGWTGQLARVAAGFFDLPTLIPVGGVAASVGRGLTSNLLRGAAAGALGGVVDAGVSEVGLQSTHVTRTGAESALNIGGSIILGGLLGAGIGKVMDMGEQKRMSAVLQDAQRPDFDAATDALHREVNDIALGQSVGAAAAPVSTMEDMAIKGRAASAVAHATAQLNPVLRTIQSPSLEVRKIATQLMENPVYLKKNMRGEGDIAAETAMQEYVRGSVVKAIEFQRNAYTNARKGGLVMTEENFRKEIGKAMRRGDVSDVPGVAAAAKTWRGAVFDPLKDRAIEANLLPADVHVDTAASYLSRMYNRPLIEANERDFRKIVRDWISGSLDRQIRSGNASAKVEDLVSAADRQAYIDEIVDDIYAKVTGKIYDGDVPTDLTITKRGPLKERTFNIPDSLIEKYLESDVEFIGRRYARTMAADIELTKRFGSPDMKDALTSISADYQKMRETILKKKDLTGPARAKQLKELSDREKADIRDIKGVRDLLRGHYRPEVQHTTWARIGKAANTFNYVRAMGGVLIASLTDAVRPAMVHGLKAYAEDGIGPLIKGTKALKLSHEEAKLAGVISEKVLASRLATMAEITDPYSHHSPFEKLLENGAVGFSKMTGLLHWNDFQRSLAATMTQNRILRNAEVASQKGFDALSESERAYMGYLGIGQGKAEDIGKLFKAHGETDDGVKVANSTSWGDDAAAAGLRRAYRAAINKDVDSIIVTKGVGDVPLLANTPIGRALLQFKSFAIASNQRVLIRGLQEDKSRFIGGVIGMSTIGMFLYWIKQVESGREVSNNPGNWITEGVDRSGIFSVAFEINNTLEKIGVPGAYTLAASAFPGLDKKAPASRYASRSTVGALLGPSFSGATDATGVMSTLIDNVRRGVSGEDLSVTSGDIAAARRLSPYASLPYWRWFIDGMLVPDLKERVGDGQ